MRVLSYLQEFSSVTIIAGDDNGADEGLRTGSVLSSSKEEIKFMTYICIYFDHRFA